MLENSLDSLNHRQVSDRGTENEHEYLWFVSGEDSSEEAVSLDVFLDEGCMTVSSDTNTDLREFFEAVESWYSVNGRYADTYCLRDGEWRSERPRDVIADVKDVECFDFHFYEDFDYFSICWTEYPDSPEGMLENEISMMVEYDNADRLPDPDMLEPLRTVFPGALGEQVSEDAKYQVVGDIIKYVNSSRQFQDSYDALMGFEDKLFRHYLGR